MAAKPCPVHGPERGELGAPCTCRGTCVECGCPVKVHTRRGWCDACIESDSRTEPCTMDFPHAPAPVHA